jgi:hypothetical protein
MTSRPRGTPGRPLAALALLAGTLGAAATLLAQQAPTAAAGPITHSVTGFKAVREIPASWTIPRFQNVAKPRPAPAGHLWYVIRGTTRNGGEQRRSVNATTLRIVDQGGAEYGPDVRNALYQPEGTAVTHLAVEPGATVEWLAFLAVPETAAGLRLLANDLSFAPKAVAAFALPDPSPAPGPATTPSPGGGNAAETEPRAAAATARARRPRGRHPEERCGSSV